MLSAEEPLVIERQGSFRVGGTRVRVPGRFDPQKADGSFNDTAGQSYHVDQLYAEYQIPPRVRPLPLVFLHGNNLDGSCWDTTPDGREGFRTIFARRGFAVYVVDFPRRGRSGAPSFTGTLGQLEGRRVVPDQTYRCGDEWSFHIWRMGDLPAARPGGQFPPGEDAIEQALLQIQPSFTDDPALISDAVVALLEKIGPAVLVTHSQGGLIGWLAAARSSLVRGIVAYEPTLFVFPEDRLPPASPSVLGYSMAATSLGEAGWRRLIETPIEVVFGDFIPPEAQPDQGLEFWRQVVHSPAGCRAFVAALSAAGGRAALRDLPDMGIRGNSHFLMYERNNLQIADMLSAFLSRHHLD